MDRLCRLSPALNGIYYTKTCEEMEEGLAKPKAVERLEEALARQRSNDGLYFNGPELSLVDGYAPFLQRFLIADRHQTGLLDGFPLVRVRADA